MREMPHGQWVAFDGSDSVHSCGQISSYDDLMSSSPTKNVFPTLPASKPSDADSGASNLKRGEQSLTTTPRKGGMPDWIDTLVGWLAVIALIYIFSLFRAK